MRFCRWSLGASCVVASREGEEEKWWSRRLLRDGGSLGSSGSGVIDNRVLSDGVGGSVVSSLSAEHALLDTSVGVGGGTGSGGGGVSRVLLSVGKVDGTGTLGVLARLELERGKVLSGEEEEVDEQEDGLGKDI